MAHLLEDAGDIFFHMDERIVHTVPPLFTRPGFLTLEYFSGRRVRYIAPFRLMFVFCLLAFFFVHVAVNGAHFGGHDDKASKDTLGAFAAAVVAGAISVETGLEATIQQAAAIEACCSPGGMIAVLARADEWIPRLDGMGEVAAINFDTHFVMAAPDDGLRDIEACLSAARVGFQRLPVRHAFHSRWIDPAEQVFLAYCSTMELSVPKIPILCCERAAPLSTVDPEHFWRVVRRPIRLAETVGQVGERSLYLDLGPSGTLATFLRYILPAPRRLKAVLSRLGRDDVQLGDLCATSAC
ncbi:hypothetical protein KCV01_g4082, partial [Aureobasidium melanogenum]